MSLLREYIRILLEQSQPTRTPLDLSIPSDLSKLHQVFKDAGLELFVVGGAVRDTLLNKTPKDYDLATGAPPDEVIALLSPDPELKIDLTGKSFGVVRVWTPEGNEYEIATFRRDIGKGRRPDAVEYTTIEDDVKRRDLTVNALFYDMDSGEVVDYVGGMADIESGTIRAVGDPAERFDEDKLRILRAVRFAGRMGSDIDPETREAILANNDLSEISPDRIHDEFVKGIKSAQDVPRFLGLMSDLGLFPQVLPGLNVNPSTGAASNDQAIQLALMLSDNDLNQIKSVLKGEKYSNEEVDSILFLLKFSDIDRESAVGLKKEFKRMRFDSNTLQEFARSSGDPSQKVVDGFLKFVDAPMPVNPRDLMAQGLQKNELGAAIQDAQKEQYDEMVNELRQYIRTLLAETAIGQCYPHATKMARGATDEEFSDLSKFKVTHGQVTDKFSGETVDHAWVEKGDTVFDWQSSYTKPEGIPRDIYYDTFQPEVHREYTAEETVVNCLKTGQHGPW